MKKSVLAMASVAAFLAAASMPAAAQVNVFGSIDTGVSYIDGDGIDGKLSLTSGGLSQNRLGFKGEERLAHGLKASFHLEAGFDENGVTGRGLGFERRATVSLSNDLGELRLGRDFKPNYHVTSAYDTLAMDGSEMTFGSAFSTLATTAEYDPARASNMASLFTKRYMGLQAQISAAASEGADGGGYRGIRLDYENGPLQVQGAYGVNKYSLGNVDQVNLGGSYEFGNTKVLGGWSKTSGDVGDSTTLSIGVAQKMIFNGELRAGYANTEVLGEKVNQFSLGYIHKMSKRTALYGNAVFLDMAGMGLNRYHLGVNHSF